MTNHDVIFTLTKANGVFYRISRDYEKDVRKFHTKKNHMPKNAEKSKDGRNRQQHTSTNVISTTMEQPTSQQI